MYSTNVRAHSRIPLKFICNSDDKANWQPATARRRPGVPHITAAVVAVVEQHVSRRQTVPERQVNADQVVPALEISTMLLNQPPWAGKARGFGEQWWQPGRRTQSSIRRTLTSPGAGIATSQAVDCVVVVRDCVAVAGQ